MSFEARNLQDIETGAGAEEVRDTAENYLFAFAVTDDEAAPRRLVVDDAKCENCHANLSLHGGNRHNGAEYCQVCHMPGALGETEVVEGEEDSIHFKYMVHKIHRGEELELVMLSVATFTMKSCSRATCGIVKPVILMAPIPFRYRMAYCRRKARSRRSIRSCCRPRQPACPAMTAMMQQHTQTPIPATSLANLAQPAMAKARPTRWIGFTPGNFSKQAERPLARQRQGASAPCLFCRSGFIRDWLDHLRPV